MSMIYQQELAEGEVDRFRQALGPFVVAAEATRMAIVFTNAREPDQPIIFANDAFLRLTGYERREVIGRPFAFLVCDTPDATARARTMGQFDDCGGETLDIECRRKDGGHVWVAICVNPVRDELGAVVQYCASFVDLSTQVERVRRERDALHILYQHTPDFITITEGPEHRYSFANAAWQKLAGERDLLGKTVAEALPELVDQQIIALLDKVYRTGVPFLGASIPVRLQRQAGADVELRFLDLIYQPVRAPDGTITGMFCEGHDSTNEIAAAEQMRVLQAEIIHLSRLSAMGTMAATLAHELTQPLTAIINFTAGCAHLNGTPGDNVERIAEGLTAIAASAQHGAEIIRRLRDMTDRRRSQRETFDLQGAIGESVALVQVGACAGVAVEDRSVPDIELQADRVQIQQVLINLLRNACESVDPWTGSVTISTAMKGSDVVVSIRDNGAGVSSKTAGTLFKWAESTKPSGTGIGLSICRTIVEAHGGELWLEKRRRGGACFSFSLPTVTERRIEGG